MSVLDPIQSLLIPSPPEKEIPVFFKKDHGVFFVYTNDPADIVGVGPTLDEAKKDFKIFYDAYMQEKGIPYRLQFDE